MIQAMILAAMVLANVVWCSGGEYSGIIVMDEAADNNGVITMDESVGLMGTIILDGLTMTNGLIVSNWEPETYEFSNYDLSLSATNAMTVQTVTNVVEDTSDGWDLTPCDKNCHAPCLGWHGTIDMNKRGTKTVTTTITRIYTLTLKWKGKTRTLVHEEVVSETVKTYKKKEEWEPVE